TTTRCSAHPAKHAAPRAAAPTATDPHRTWHTHGNTQTAPPDPDCRSTHPAASSPHPYQTKSTRTGTGATDPRRAHPASTTTPAGTAPPAAAGRTGRPHPAGRCAPPTAPTAAPTSTPAAESAPAGSRHA